jgi:RNA polymerase sigma-70 factor (ECF subfamily)
MQSKPKVAMTDRELLDRLAAGDEGAAQVFDRAYRPRLMRFLATRGILPPEAEDLVQDVFLAVFRQIRDGRFRGDSGVWTWVISILNNKVADYRASRGRSSIEVPMPAGATELEHQRRSHPPLLGHDPEKRVVVTEILDRLPKLHRVILLLHEAEGWITDEIADRLKMNPNTVGRKLWEAKRMLRALGQPMAGGGDRKQIGPANPKKSNEGRD